MQKTQNERPSAVTSLSPADAENLNENSKAKDSCAAAPSSASGNVISLLEESDTWIECRMPNYNENGKPFISKQRPQVIQVLIDQMAFQLYGKEYDPILGRLAEVHLVQKLSEIDLSLEKSASCLVTSLQELSALHLTD